MNLLQILSDCPKVNLLEIEISVKPYNPNSYNEPFSLSISSDDQIVTHQRKKGNTDTVKLILLQHLSSLDSNGILQLMIESNQCSSPYQITGSGTSKTPLSVQFIELNVRTPSMPAETF